MTTFNDTNSLASVKDFSSELVREFIGDYCVRGKAIDPATEDPVKLFNRVDWLLNRIGRSLDVTGKLDPANTTFRIDRDAENIVRIRFIDLKGKTLYTLALGDKEAMKNGGEFEYILTDANGEEVARGHKWSTISKYFAPATAAPKESPATPKAVKAPKASKAHKESPKKTEKDSEKESA